jgi:hypothetical protein
MRPGLRRLIVTSGLLIAVAVLLPAVALNWMNRTGTALPYWSISFRPADGAANPAPVLVLHGGAARNDPNQTAGIPDAPLMEDEVRRFRGVLARFPPLKPADKIPANGSLMIVVAFWDGANAPGLIPYEIPQASRQPLIAELSHSLSPINGTARARLAKLFEMTNQPSQ